MKNLYLAKSMEELNKKADLNLPTIHKTSIDKLLKSAQKMLEEGNTRFKERDEERAYVMFFKFVSLILYIDKRAGESEKGDVLRDIQSLKNLAGSALEKAEQLKVSLGQRYEEAIKAKSLQSAAAPKKESDVEDTSEKSTISAECSINKKQVSLIDSGFRRTMTCQELYAMIGDTSVKFLLIDVRPASEFVRANIPHSNSINIPAEILKPGITDSEIELSLKGATLCKWKEINEFDYVLIMDYCTEGNAKNLSYSHPLRLMEELILNKYKGGIVKSPPRIVEGGYKEWLLSHAYVYVERMPNLMDSSIEFPEDVIEIHDKQSNTYPNLEKLTINDNYDENRSEICSSPQVTNNMEDMESHHTKFSSSAPPVNRHTKPGQLVTDTLSFISKNIDLSSSTSEEKIMYSHDIPSVGKKSSNNNYTEDASTAKYIPEVDRSLKPTCHHMNISNRTNNGSVALNREEAVLTDILSIALEQINKEKEFEQLRLRKELEAEESKRIEIQKQEAELLENITILTEKSKNLELQYKMMKNENKKMKKMLSENPLYHQDVVAKELQKARMQEEVERLRKIRKMKEENVKGIKSFCEKDEKDNMSCKEQAKESAEQKILTEKEYTAPLREFDGTGGSSNLTRSYSSPNIAQMVAEEISETKTSRHPAVDRSLKPKIPRSLAMKNEISSRRIRDLNPIYGNATVRGTTGLKNLGNTCYMNAIIQCLSNTKQIALYFESDNYRQHLRKSCTNGEVAEEFAVVIKSLWAGQYKSFSPKDFKNILSKYIPMCKGSDQQDSHEFLLVFMDKLHADLNQGQNVAPLQNFDSLSDNEAAESFWNHHQTKNKSKISEIFEGLLQSSLSCCSCNHTSNSYEIFSCVSLPISSTKCTLQDCLTTFMKPEMICGEAAWDCPSCKGKREAEKFSTFLRLPNVLIIQLKRFSYDGRWKSKLQVFVDFPYDLEIKVAGMKSKCYKLYGVINHIGLLDGGHYTAYCKNYRNGKWYHYDDCNVTETSASLIKTHKAYLLFYSM